jgi:hypothetical protein
MTYARGDRVTITEDRDYVKTGSAGTVTQLLPEGAACWVLFDMPYVELPVPERILQPAQPAKPD